MAWDLVATPSGHRGCGIPKNERLVVSLTGGGSGKDDKLRLSVRLSVALLKEARWVIGDYVQIYRDGNSDLFLLKRDISGFMISASGCSKKKGLTQEMRGTTKVVGRIQFPSGKFSKNCKVKGIPCENITINEQGIMFVMPKEILA